MFDMNHWHGHRYVDTNNNFF